MQPSQRNQAELPEFRAADAKSKAANFRAVETKHEPWTSSFQSGQQTATRLMGLEMGMLGLRCHFRRTKF
jgi:hypothetical protein